MFREVEKMQNEVLGEKHAHTLTSNHWIATWLYENQQFHRADLIFKEVENQKEVL